jgi:ketosteroid isomerase-like protein
MLMLLLAQAAQPAMSAVDAERAFASAAQRDGQWTAFRRYAADDALMFTPQPVNAQQFLKPLKDPPHSVEWWPARSVTSCDGRMAVNTGPWRRADGSNGYFTTVWMQQDDGSWKWIYDAGDDLTKPMPRPAEPEQIRASCDGDPPSATAIRSDEGSKAGAGRSPDGTLVYRWTVDRAGARSFTASAWNGADWDVPIRDQVKAAHPQ